MGALFSDKAAHLPDAQSVAEHFAEMDFADPSVRGVAVCDTGTGGRTNYRMTIPLDFARQLGIDDETDLLVTVEGDGLLVRPA